MLQNFVKAAKKAEKRREDCKNVCNFGVVAAGRPSELSHLYNRAMKFLAKIPKYFFGTSPGVPASPHYNAQRIGNFVGCLSLFDLFTHPNTIFHSSPFCDIIAEKRLS